MRHKAIPAEFFTSNRKRLASAMKPGGIAVLNSNDIMPTNADGTMPFRQNSDLFYLTGIGQEETMLLLFPDAPSKSQREILFIRKPDELLEKWEGHKLTKAEATALSGIESILFISDFQKTFHHLMTMGGGALLYLNTNEHYRSEVVVQTRDARFIDWCKIHYPLHPLERLAPLMGNLRCVKSTVEINLMQEACNITESGFRRILKFVKPGVWEYEIEAEFIHEFIKNRSRGFAYQPIIASGANNVILHYTDNNRQCKSGDLVLMDVGAEYANYNADMTRTIPVSGKFSKRQKQVYKAVHRVLKTAQSVMSTSIKYFDYHREIEKVLASELVGLKLINKSDLNQKGSEQAFRKYYYHGTSHMLGLDVHDVGDMHDNMKAGSVWTIEPGIYIKEEGFGIRLENNFQLNRNGVKDLMKNIPLEADEIEDLMNSK
jgi:Xaa-Pro aminopeptidase